MYKHIVEFNNHMEKIMNVFLLSKEKYFDFNKKIYFVQSIFDIYNPFY